MLSGYRAIVVMVVLLAVLVAARLCVAPLPEIFRWPSDSLIWSIRGSRAWTCITVGGTLALAGYLLQSVFRNPLASPEILGVSSGASLGVMIGIYLASTAGIASSAFGGTSVWASVPAVLGALGTLGLIVALSARQRSSDPTSLVLLGVVVSVLCGAGIMFVQHLMPDTGFSTARLLIGAISDDTPVIMLGLVSVALAVVGIGAMGATRLLDALGLSDDEAQSVGVGLGRVRLMIFLAAGVLTAGAVTLAGPIGFVGLIGPHIARRLIVLRDQQSTMIVPVAVMVGSCVMLGADVLIRVIDLGAGRMPVGILTALIGGPLLIWLIRKSAWRMP